MSIIILQSTLFQNVYKMRMIENKIKLFMIYNLL